MQNKLNQTLSWHQKSHEALIKLLNNIGVIGAILAGVADIVFVIIMVLGVHVEAELNAIIIYACVNALIGVLINVLLRYQGRKYAELENQELCEKYYRREVKERKYLSIEKWMALMSVKDVLMKGCTTAFSIFGIVYISITGSKNPIQILLTLATLILFACFGLMAMNAAYTRFYNVQVPLMQAKVQEREVTEASVAADETLEDEDEALEAELNAQFIKEVNQLKEAESV